MKQVNAENVSKSTVQASASSEQANVDNLLKICVEESASDLHMSKGRTPVIRAKGRLIGLDMPALTKEMTEAFAKQITPPRNWEELTQIGTTDFAIQYKDGTRFRVSLFHQKGSFGCVLRRIPNKLLSFDEIGIPESVKELLNRPRGLILVTGPTGSGKTTTLATMVDYINQIYDRHIVTIEDPIEYFHEHKKSIVTQREIGSDVPTFAEAMRRVLRMDPDVILLGEMRDLETISAAITAAETGHLVFGTLHTTGAYRTINRVVDAYPKEQQEQVRAMLSVSVIAVISQVLMPRADKSGLVAGFEVMTTTPAIENHIRKNETYKITSVIQTSKNLGMVLLDDYLLDLHKKGQISRDVMLEKAQNASDLAARAGSRF